MKIILNLTILNLLILICNTSVAQLVIYPSPNNVTKSSLYDLEVNGQTVFVYETKTAAIAYFSFEGKIDLKVIVNSPIYNFDIRPKSKNIETKQYRDEIIFTLDKPENLSVEINKNINKPLFIFANPLEINQPTKNTPNTIFFEAGKIHKVGVIKLQKNQTVYIAGGAVVQGNFIIDSTENVKITGRGILDNSIFEKGKVRPIEINRSNNVLIDGIIISESKHWSCASLASKNVTYHNFKIVSDNDWDDGIDIVGSQNVLVDKVFIRTKDDCIAVKSGVTYYTKFKSDFNVNNIVIQNSTFWNGDWGNALEIGFETRADTIQNITFKNCDIIHTEGPEGTFTIHNGDRAFVKSILYENIRVEDAKGWLIDFRIMKSNYTKDQKRGKVEGVHFKTISVEGNHYPSSQILGFSDDHIIKDVTLEDFTIHGKKIVSIYNGMLAIIHCENIKFK
ncbi:glycosyl hydrolase family 28 protein [Lacihabitans sp. CS3-21]|uniref:glycosyl hydrolase family 28 protein n=1 Tax=Lacihabitans sp. CS3-21 TaxID=2487332 RepID=UPI0020CCBAF5|nr:glycosyl hydrolase family 28 protein [Lacihabitans sp. CS3-21]MCP9746406.1 hypothetical protein [Lacihabitans sp. CS3-21]